MERRETYAFRNIRTRKIEIAIHRTVLDENGRHVEQHLTYDAPCWVTHDDKLGAPIEATLEVNIEDMESVFTEMWRDGMRPEGWTEQPAMVPTHDVERLSAENERLRMDIEREIAAHTKTGQRLDHALELIGMEPSKRRVQVRRGGNSDEQETQDP